MRGVYSDNVADSNYWPVRQLPDPALTNRVMRLMDDGLSDRAIATATGINVDRVRFFRREPWKWEPHVDQVAVDRAMSGDKSVLPRLTMFERRALQERLTARLLREPAEPHHSGRDVSEHHWLSALGHRWGIDPHRLRAQVNKRLVRQAKAAA